jgi:ferredoxin--NADP+ reductase
VSVRKMSDLAYLDTHRALEGRFSNYHYVPLPTREPDVPKRYIQAAIADGSLTQPFGAALDPGATHVFMCGNPAMIGPPSWDGDQPVFPESQGVVEVLTNLGFQADRRDAPGNVHYEEYW